jgi:hypothetical protein
MKNKRDVVDPEIIDEPGMAERFQRGLQRALNTPPQHRTKRAPRPTPETPAKESPRRSGG